MKGRFCLYKEQWMNQKSGREPAQICHVKCVISVGRMRGFVECSFCRATRTHGRAGRGAESLCSNLVKEQFGMKDKARE